MTILVAGIGNIFLGDDAFGVEVVRDLARRPLPDWVRVVDFGIRGFDLTYALLDERYDAAVLLDTVKRGHAPGTLSVIIPELDGEEMPPDVPLETHGMEPVNVLRVVRVMGGAPRPLRIVGCEPLHVESEDDMTLGMSEVVAAAIEPAASLALEVAESLRAETSRRA